MLLPRHWKLHTEETVIADSLQVIPSSIRCKSALLSVRPRSPFRPCPERRLWSDGVKTAQRGRETTLTDESGQGDEGKGLLSFSRLMYVTKKERIHGERLPRERPERQRKQR